MKSKLDIAKARGLLSDPSISMKDVAQQCGYAAERPFRRAFNAATGQTPLTYRQEATKSPPRNIKREIDRIIRFLRNCDLKPETVAVRNVSKTLNIPASVFEHPFSRRRGMPYSKFVITLRINRAKAQLESTNDTIETIAEKVGYANPTAFATQFQKETGLTPSAWREEHGTAQKKSGIDIPADVAAIIEHINNADLSRDDLSIAGVTAAVLAKKKMVIDKCFFLAAFCTGHRKKFYRFCNRPPYQDGRRTPAYCNNARAGYRRTCRLYKLFGL